VKNLQGDITQIIRDDGTIVVEYFYDAFGQILDITGSLTATIGQYNSLRYRSYKYDNELKFYYLNSRYYNPEIGRFISSDGQIGELGNILSTNMYAYCANNPVMYSDTTGYAPEAWQIALGVIGAALVVTAVVMTIFSSGGVGAFGVGALWGSLILGTAGAVIGGVVANAINADILGGILAGFGIGASVGFFAGGFYTYGHYRAASLYLHDAGLSPNDQASYLKSFRKGTIRVKTLKGNASVYRYWDGNMAAERGRFLTTKLYNNPIDKLSLAYGNTASNVSCFSLPHGTTYLSGRAAKVGFLHGGGIQWFIANSSWLI
jgi:RHS repeat-associated protein